MPMSMSIFPSANAGPALRPLVAPDTLQVYREAMRSMPEKTRNVVQPLPSSSTMGVNQVANWVQQERLSIQEPLPSVKLYAKTGLSLSSTPSQTLGWA